MNAPMTATRLRFILSISMVIIILATIAGFLLVQRNLKEYALAISALNADANSGDKNLQTLSGLQARLDEERVAMEGAHALIADNTTYADMAINDISRIANQSGVKITSFEFVDGASATPGAGAATLAPATSPTVAPAAGGEAAIPVGVTKKTVSVSLESPLPYSSLMKFLSGIESNPLKMQIPSVSMTKDKGSDVSTEQFSIEVYVRQ